MLINASTLKGYTLHGLDGSIGTVKEFYFDDTHWAIRYLVADTRSWLTSRKVLISPYSLTSVNREEQQIGINLTKQKIEDSPAVGSEKPVSRQCEADLLGFYNWPMYWQGPYMWGAGFYPSIMPDAEQGRELAHGFRPYGTGSQSTNEPRPVASEQFAPDEGAWDPHLRSTHDVTGHHIQAADGEIGHVDDFVLDDETWAIRYLVVDTVNWWPGKKVLIAARWIDRVSWDESKVFTGLARAAIKQAPEYEEGSLLTRDVERKLHEHYQRQGYWVDEPAAETQPS